MALSTRELYLVLRARDEASRTLRGLSRELLATGAAAEMAQARASAAAARQEADRLRATGATKAQIQTALDLARAYDDEARAIQNATSKRQHYINVMSNAGTALQTLGVATAAAGLGTLLVLKQSVDAAVEYERQVAHTRTQVDGFSASLQELHDIGLKTARNVGIAFKDIQPTLFDIFSSTNANLKEGELLLNAFAKAAVAGQSDIQTASKGTISIMNAFNIPFSKVNDLLDVQFQIIRKGRITYEEFGNVIGNIIPSATRAGQSFEMVGAMLAFMTRNGLSAAMAATSGARALEAMSHPKTIKRLREMGINALTAAGEMRPLTEILQELRNKIEKLPPAQRVAALVDLLKGAGGTIQARRFLEQVLLEPGELEELKGFLDDMGNASGAFEEKYAEMSNTVAVQSELLRNRWEALKIAVGTALLPAFTDLIGQISKVVEWFNNLPKSTQESIAKFLLYGSIIAIVVGAFMTIIGVIAMFVAAVAAAGTGLLYFIGIVGGLLVAGAAVVMMFKSLWENSKNFRDIIGIIGERAGQLKDALGELFSQIATAWDDYMSVPLSRVADIIENRFMPGVEDMISKFSGEFVQKLIEAGRIIGDHVSKSLEWLGLLINTVVVPALQWLSGWWEKNRKSVEPFFPILAQLMKWFVLIAAFIVGTLVVVFVGPLVAAIVIAIAVIIAIVEAVQAFVGWIKTLIGWIGNVIAWFGSFGRSTDIAKSAILNFAASVPGAIRNAFSNLGSLLESAGEAIIRGLIQGMKNMMGNLVSMAKQVGAAIIANKGPMEKDRRMLRPAGQAIMAGLMQGIHDELPALINQLQGIEAGIKFQMSADGSDRRVGGFAAVPPAAPVTQSVTKIYNNTFNVTTQEIDPRVHSAQLGWELNAVTG